MSMPEKHQFGGRRPPSPGPNNILSHPPRRASRIVPEFAEFASGRWQADPKAEYAKWVCQLAAHLPDSERELLMTIFGQGRPTHEVANLMGISTNTLRRRVRKLIARISLPAFAFVALRRGEWPARLRDVATSSIIEGKSLRVTSTELSLSMHTVRTLRQRAMAMARGAQETRDQLDREEPAINRAWR
jgi:DNA-binding CsgD family transcriptional regulator